MPKARLGLVQDCARTLWLGAVTLLLRGIPHYLPAF